MQPHSTSIQLKIRIKFQNWCLPNFLFWKFSEDQARLFAGTSCKFVGWSPFLWVKPSQSPLAAPDGTPETPSLRRDWKNRHWGCKILLEPSKAETFFIMGQLKLDLEILLDEEGFKLDKTDPNHFISINLVSFCSVVVLVWWKKLQRVEEKKGRSEDTKDKTNAFLDILLILWSKMNQFLVLNL